MALSNQQITNHCNRMAAIGALVPDEGMFVVYEKRELVVAEGYGEERIDWFDSDNQVTASRRKRALLERLRGDADSVHYTDDEITLEDGSEWRRVAVREVNNFVTVCFTREGAEAFIKRHGHNLRKPFVYTVIGNVSEEFKEVRQFLKAIGERR